MHLRNKQKKIKENKENNKIFDLKVSEKLWQTEAGIQDVLDTHFEKLQWLLL